MCSKKTCVCTCSCVCVRMSYQVIHQVFDGSDSQHHHQRNQRGVPGQCGNVWNNLTKQKILHHFLLLVFCTTVNQKPTVMFLDVPAGWAEPGNTGLQPSWTVRTDSGGWRWGRCTCTSWWRFPAWNTKQPVINAWSVSVWSCAVQVQRGTPAISKIRTSLLFVSGNIRSVTLKALPRK